MTPMLCNKITLTDHHDLTLFAFPSLYSDHRSQPIIIVGGNARSGSLVRSPSASTVINCILFCARIILNKTAQNKSSLPHVPPVVQYRVTKMSRPCSVAHNSLFTAYEINCTCSITFVF